MKPRIEKKLSKRLVELAPTMFEDAWIDKEIELFPVHYSWQNNRPLTPKQERENRHQQVRVNGIWSVGGGSDYWGEANESDTVWGFWRSSWFWRGDFPEYPAGHENEFFPDTTGFRPTTRNLLRLAVEVERKIVAKKRSRV